MIYCLLHIPRKPGNAIFRSIFIPGFLFMLAFMLSACSLRKPRADLPLNPPESFSVSGSLQVPERWWTSLDDSALNAAIDTALASNFTLKTAWYRLSEARAVVDRESASLLPEIFASMRAETGSGQTDFEVYDNMSMGLTAEYELDLWGRIRYGIEGEEYRMEATRADFRAAALSLSAEVAIAWYRLAEARAQLEIAKEQTETNEKILKLLKNRFGNGQIRSVDIFRQEQLLEASREREIFRKTQIGLLEHQLAILMGRPPEQESQETAAKLPPLPPLPETGVPIELIRRRPDVQSAYNQLLAADRDMAAAISNRYPRLSFSAQLTTRGESADQLFKSWAYSFSAGLLAPLFYGGELQAEVDRNEAVKNRILYEYGQTVLVSFREVEDALIREVNQQERINSLMKQLELAGKSHKQLRAEYFNGLSNYLDVLTALEQEQQLRRDLLSARLELLEYRVALYRALAGGFGPGADYSERRK